METSLFQAAFTYGSLSTCAVIQISAQIVSGFIATWISAKFIISIYTKLKLICSCIVCILVTLFHFPPKNYNNEKCACEICKTIYCLDILPWIMEWRIFATKTHSAHCLSCLCSIYFCSSYMDRCYFETLLAQLNRINTYLCIVSIRWIKSTKSNTRPQQFIHF